MREFLAAMCMEAFRSFNGDFLKRFEAIRHEAGIDDGDALDAFLRQLLDSLVGIGLQPFLRPEAGLEGDLQLFLRPAELFAQQAAPSCSTGSDRDRPS